MTPVVTLPVSFADVDPAGIVFYPRYFEMLNAALEDWFAHVLDADFPTMHLVRRLGTPTVRLEADFAKASRLGELLDIGIAAERLGRSSCAVRYAVSCAGEPRLTARATIVCMDLVAGCARPWPDDIRARLAAALTS